jgi:Glycoside-hydrolase family GH114
MDDSMTHAKEEAKRASFERGGWMGYKHWPARRKILSVSLVLFTVVALAVGLGVGLGIGLNNNSGGETPLPTPTSPPNVTAKWQPSVGTTWQIELLYPLNDTSANVELYDIDLFSTSALMISQMHAAGRRVVCYFSAGSYENWRPDANKFDQSDLGNVLDGWPDERWLNISSPNVRQIMLSRLDMATAKGCDGVDPDNVDGYDNDNGLDLTAADSVDYVNFLADAAHERNMSIGLKNAGGIIPSVIGIMQWSVNEQCVQFQECSTYAAFTAAGKPVFHIEYPKGANTNNGLLVTSQQKYSACQFQDSSNFSTIIKNMNLDNWYETC